VTGNHASPVEDSVSRAPRSSDHLTDLELFTRAEVAAALKIRPSWLRDNQTRLALPHTVVGRQVRYSREDVAVIASMGRATVPTDPFISTPITLTPLPKRGRSTGG
jgi:hypothetical protein